MFVVGGLIGAFVFAFLLIFVEASSCPDESYEYQSNCYIFSIIEAGFSRAESRCIQLGGHLTSIHDAFTNGVLAQKGLEYFEESTDTDFWIGYSNGSWTDGTPLDFIDWKVDEPQNTSNCAAFSLTDGLWNTQECYKAKPFVCAVVDSTTDSFPTPTSSTN